MPSWANPIESNRPNTDFLSDKKSTSFVQTILSNSRPSGNQQDFIISQAKGILPKYKSYLSNRTCIALSRIACLRVFLHLLSLPYESLLPCVSTFSLATTPCIPFSCRSTGSRSIPQVSILTSRNLSYTPSQAFLACFDLGIART